MLDKEENIVLKNKTPKNLLVQVAAKVFYIFILIQRDKRKKRTMKIKIIIFKGTG